MKGVRVIYRREDNLWWAESPNVPGFVATGATLGEVRTLVREGIPFHLDLAPGEVDLVESGEHEQIVVDVHYSSGALQVSSSNSGSPSSNVHVAPAARTPVWA